MPKTITALLFLLFFVRCAGFSGDSPAPVQGREAEEGKFTPFVDCDRGYRVNIPSGLLAQTPGDAGHGFLIDLPDGQSKIFVYNEFNMSESLSPRKVFDYELKIRSDSRPEWKILSPAWRILSRHYERIKGLPGVRVTALYREKGLQWKTRCIMLYRAPDSHSEGDIVYSFELAAPLDRYEKVSAELDKVLDGFELTKLPLGPCSND